MGGRTDDRGATIAGMSSMRTVLAAAGLLASGLSLASPVLACPGEGKQSKPKHEMVAAVQQSTSEECAYASARRTSGCCGGASFGSRLLAVSVPAGLIAFGLGWLSGGRRRRDESDKTEVLSGRRGGERVWRVLGGG